MWGGGGGGGQLASESFPHFLNILSPGYVCVGGGGGGGVHWLGSLFIKVL